MTLGWIQEALASAPVQHALVAGSEIAFLSGLVGAFVILRGQSFAGHVLTDVGTTGGAGAYLVGLNGWFGFLSFGVIASVGMELAGGRTRGERDLATGVVLSLALGFGALFLYLDAQLAHANASMAVLFGSLFTLDPALVPWISSLAAVCAAAMLLIWRPLALASVNPELARVRGVPVRAMSIAFMVVLAVAVETDALVAGSLLATALIVGPAAAAARFVSNPLRAGVAAGVLGAAIVVASVLLSYDSYNWLPQHTSWPVSFFVAALAFLAYVVPAAARRFGVRRMAEVTEA
ncbi:metal ABC transporter permease [Alicyclobacillus fructus]|uniref:metal ABC transporter permease n=1 Tax=Alicyclobacillus fructus TaxID=2816082 RepID=UPI001A905F87|nr:metal ABC transporter permease [Alicyclobacillus fructus]